MAIHGREQERRIIASLLGDARSGHGRVLVIRGEAGIGKTTLLRDAAHNAPDLRLLTCSGVESEVELAFSGLHQLLGPILDELDLLPDVQAAALSGALGLAESTTDGFLVSAAVLTLLAQVAERRPLLVVVDDLQFLDRASTAALLFAARRLVAEPMAMLIGVRDPDRRQTNTVDLPELRLSGLSMPAAIRLLNEHGWKLPASARETLVTTTGGNPLALTELTRVADLDGLVGQAILHRTVPLGPRLRAAFAQRAEGLSVEARQMLLVAAADDTGQTEMVTGAAGRLGVPAEMLMAATESGLIEIDGAHLGFRHPLMRSAIYQDAPFGRRCSVHLAISRELAERGETDRATWHRAVAAHTPDEQLATALERSAEAAVRRGGGAAIASVLQRAATLSETAVGRTRRLAAAAWAAWQSGQAELAKTLARQADSQPSDAPTKARLSRLHGFVELASGDPAAAYSRLVGSAELIARTDPVEAVNLLMVAADAAFGANRLDDARRAAERITAVTSCTHASEGYRRVGQLLSAALAGTLTSRDDDSPWTMLGLPQATSPAADARQWTWTMGICRFGPNQRQAREYGLAACAHLRSIGMIGIVAIVLPWLAELEFLLGLWADAAMHAEEGIRIARETGQRSRVSESQSLLACLSAVQGDVAGCQQLADQAIACAAHNGSRLVAARANWALAHLALSEGDVQEAYDRLADLDTTESPYAHQHIARQAMPDLVDAAVRAGQREHAEWAVAAFAEWAMTTSLPWAHGHLYLCEALLSQDDSADELFRAALAEQRTQDRPFDSARTALLHGEWLRRNRRRTDARRQLRVAAALFDQLGADRWARSARAQLRAVGGSAPRVEASVVAALTPQELQVAQLAARGLSNREIGAQLFLSPRTVGYHLYKLFPKLGITARAQLRSIDFGDRLPDVS